MSKYEDVRMHFKDRDDSSIVFSEQQSQIKVFTD